MANHAMLLALVVLLTACSGGTSETPAATASSGPPTTEPATEPAPIAPAPGPAAVPPGTDRCEGLVGSCGGWEGCVTVRADPTTPGAFVGVGPNVGHLYAENHDCNAGVCNEICTGGSLSGCRPGVTERVPDVACSGAHAPTRAPFTCRMQDGVCIQGPDPDMIPAS
jgi:hypothetical protein